MECAEGFSKREKNRRARACQKRMGKWYSLNAKRKKIKNVLWRKKNEGQKAFKGEEGPGGKFTLSHCFQKLHSNAETTPGEKLEKGVGEEALQG